MIPKTKESIALTGYFARLYHLHEFQHLCLHKYAVEKKLYKIISENSRNPMSKGTNNHL